MATTSVRSLQGEEMLTSYEADVPQEAFDIQEMKGPDIPLMPLVLGIHFVSNTSGEGIQNLKKTLYKVSSRLVLFISSFHFLFFRWDVVLSRHNSLPNHAPL